MIHSDGWLRLYLHPHTPHTKERHALLSALKGGGPRRQNMMDHRYLDTYPALAVANSLLILALDDGRRGIDHLGLQKLVYFVDGLSWAHRGGLVDALPAIWRYGPIYPDMYAELKGHRGHLIPGPVAVGVGTHMLRVPRVDTYAHRVIQAVWNDLRSYSSVELSELAHAPGTPWKDTATAYNFRVPADTRIPAHLMTTYFTGRIGQPGTPILASHGPLSIV